MNLLLRVVFYLVLIFMSTPPQGMAQSSVVTGITDIFNFLNRCPTNDPAYNQIRQDFELRIDGQLITYPISCSEPITNLPINQYTDELIALQTLRTAYYMGIGTENNLPWTSKSLYDWMKSNVSGINIKTAPGQLYCCDVINGKQYFSFSRQDETQRNFKRDWKGIAIELDFFAHEIRHSEPGTLGHTYGCLDFPLSTGTWSCDVTYDLNNLGAYGVQYWLESKWATGYLNIGIGCLPPDTAKDYAMWNADCANGFRDRFVNNIPPEVTPIQPYGGPCLTSCTYTIAPASSLVSSSGNTGIVIVTTTLSSCSWTAVSNASWITINAGSAGTGNGTVFYSVSANTTGSNRTGTITVGGNTFTITQKKKAGLPWLLLLLTQKPVDGICGPASGGGFSEPPSQNLLCSTGTASAVTLRIGMPPVPTTWNWSCIGYYGGLDVNCHAHYSTIPY